MGIDIHRQHAAFIELDGKYIGIETRVDLGVVADEAR